MNKLPAIALSLFLCATAQAKPEPYTGPDYSGTYHRQGRPRGRLHRHRDDGAGAGAEHRRLWCLQVTAIASFTKNKAGQWSFSNYCFEPEFKGGNLGMERCVQQ